ncbi:MAG: outer membrane beta-barrel protein [Sphingomonadaceae bacterium]|nr:outer membrane beta-barrel protein [Sphingomonadaceae bacterium]
MIAIKSLKLALACGCGALVMLPELAAAESFNGPYAGIEAGLGILKTEGSILTGPFKETDNSAVTSAVIGYRMPLGKNAPVVLGAEGSAGIYTNGGDARYGVSGIGGVRLGDKALIYGRVGYAWLDGIQTGAGKGVDGLVLGGGVELALTKRISARADYKHIDYGGVNFPDNTLDFKGHEITGSLLFNF